MIYVQLKNRNLGTKMIRLAAIELSIDKLYKPSIKKLGPDREFVYRQTLNCSSIATDGYTIVLSAPLLKLLGKKLH